MVARAREPSSSVTSRPTASRPAWTTTWAIPAPIVPRPTTPTRRISTARDPTGMADDVLAFLRELEPRTWELAAWTRERVRAADPDLAERLYRGWRGIGFRHPE